MASIKYLLQVMEEHKMNSENIGEVYEVVCRHLEDVEAAKNALEMVLENKKEKKSRLYYLEEANRITDEIIQLLEDAGYGLKSDDWKTNWEEMIKHAEEWEKRNRQRIEEQRREAQKSEEQRKETQGSEE